MPSQIDLFAKPERAFRRVPCAKCGREIVTRELPDKSIRSEYSDLRQLCWGCAIEAKHGARS